LKPDVKPNLDPIEVEGLVMEAMQTMSVSGGVESCPAPNLLIDYVAGRCSYGMRRHIRNHLRCCADCASLAINLRSQFALVRTMNTQWGGWLAAYRAATGRLDADEALKHAWQQNARRYPTADKREKWIRTHGIHFSASFAMAALILVGFVSFVLRPPHYSTSDMQALAQWKQKAAAAQDQVRVVTISAQQADERRRLAEANAKAAEARLVATSKLEKDQSDRLQKQIQQTKEELAIARSKDLSEVNAVERTKQLLFASATRWGSNNSLLLGPTSKETAITLVSPLDTATREERPTFAWKIDPTKWRASAADTGKIIFEITLSDSIDTRSLYKEVSPIEAASGSVIRLQPSDTDLPLTWRRRGVTYRWNITAYREKASRENILAGGTSSGAWYTIPEEAILTDLDRKCQSPQHDPLELAYCYLQVGFRVEAKQELRRVLKSSRTSSFDRELAGKLLATLEEENGKPSSAPMDSPREAH